MYLKNTQYEINQMCIHTIWGTNMQLLYFAGLRNSVLFILFFLNIGHSNSIIKYLCMYRTNLRAFLQKTMIFKYLPSSPTSTFHNILKSLYAYNQN